MSCNKNQIKNTKKIRMRTCAVAVALLFLLSALAGCGEGKTAENQKLTVVCTTFPGYDWVRTVISGAESEVQLYYLADSGVDLHNYQPSAEDLLHIGQSDLLICVGGQSETWLDSALERFPKENRTVFCMTEQVQLREEETPEGAEHDHDHDHDGEDHDHDEHDAHDETEYDEHVWLSLRNAQTLVGGIAACLEEYLPSYKELFASNVAQYQADLQALDDSFTETVTGAARKTILVADRYPFRYLAEDYGLTGYAAFTGCSAETEASFETVAFLVEKTNQLSLPVILITDASDGSIARTVRDGSDAKNQEILSLSSCQTVSRAQIEAGVTYLSMMRENLTVLARALN